MILQEVLSQTHPKSVSHGMPVSAVGPVVDIVFATSANTAVVSTVGTSVFFPHPLRLVHPIHKATLPQTVETTQLMLYIV